MEGRASSDIPAQRSVITEAGLISFVGEAKKLLDNNRPHRKIMDGEYVHVSVLT
jgi:hypothetical protein